MGTTIGVETTAACGQHAPRLVSVNDEYGAAREFACTSCGHVWFE